MAKINKQEVIQKLVDELKLYPGKDLIPNELADKILAVYQINEQAVKFEPEGDIRKFVDLTVNDSDKTITVPSGKQWEILSIGMTYKADATVGNRSVQLIIKDADGNHINFIGSTDSIAASYTVYFDYYSGVDAALQDYGAAGLHIKRCMQLPLTLVEGSTLRFWDKAAIAAAGDDMEIYVLVRESDYEDKFS